MVLAVRKLSYCLTKRCLTGPARPHTVWPTGSSKQDTAEAVQRQLAEQERLHRARTQDANDALRRHSTEGHAPFHIAESFSEGSPLKAKQMEGSVRGTEGPGTLRRHSTEGHSTEDNVERHTVESLSGVSLLKAENGEVWRHSTRGDAAQHAHGAGGNSRSEAESRAEGVGDAIERRREVRAVTHRQCGRALCYSFAPYG